MGSKTAARSRLLDEQLAGGGTDAAGSFKLPDFGETPQFLPPQIDDTRVSQLAQQIASPEIRRLRRGLSQSLTRRADNPAVQAMIRGRSLEGFGQGLEGITSASRTAALQQALPEFRAEQEATRFGAETERSRQMAEFEARLGLDREQRAAARLEEGREEATRLAAPRHTTFQQSRSPLSSLGLKRSSGFQSNPRFSSPRSGGGDPVVNTKFWKGGFAQQQEATRLSDKFNIPLKSFYGSSSPSSVYLDSIDQG